MLTATRLRRTVLAGLVGATVPLALLSCSAPQAVVQPPVVLTIGLDDKAPTPAGEQVRHLAAEVQRRSDGGLLIKPTYKAAGYPEKDYDQAVARMVTARRLDLGLVPTRAWDVFGVTSLRALNAPFVVTNEGLLKEVVRGDLRGRLLSGIGKADVVGLDLFPEGLRHPFAFDEPLLGADDYRGRAVRVPTSRTTFAFFEGLGAKPTGVTAVQESTLRGVESSFALSPASVATGNVTLYPRVNALVAAHGAYDRLTDEQRRILADAAAATRSWASRTMKRDSVAAAEFCAHGGRIERAGAAALASLRPAAADVVARLRQDPLTASILDGIEQAKRTHPDGEPIERCAQSAEPGVGGTAIAGTYQYTVTRADADTRHVPTEERIGNVLGTFRWTLDADGGYRLRRTLPDGRVEDSSGTYTLEGDRLTLRYAQGPDLYVAGDVEIRDDRSLQLTKVVDGEGSQYAQDAQTWIGSHPWKRIG